MASSCSEYKSMCLKQQTMVDEGTSMYRLLLRFREALQMHLVALPFITLCLLIVILLHSNFHHIIAFPFVCFSMYSGQISSSSPVHWRAYFDDAMPAPVEFGVGTGYVWRLLSTKGVGDVSLTRRQHPPFPIHEFQCLPKGPAQVCPTTKPSLEKKKKEAIAWET